MLDLEGVRFLRIRGVALIWTCAQFGPCAAINWRGTWTLDPRRGEDEKDEMDGQATLMFETELLLVCVKGGNSHFRSFDFAVTRTETHT